MKEITGDLWDFHKAGHWVVITTNGDVTRAGLAVMGRGVAREAALRFTGIAAELAYRLRVHGNHVHAFGGERHLLTFPVKHHWQERADLELIKRSVEELKDAAQGFDTIYMPRPGCGNGKLKWEDVRPLLVGLSDRFVVVWWWGRTRNA